MDPSRLHSIVSVVASPRALYILLCSNRKLPLINVQLPAPCICISTVFIVFLDERPRTVCLVDDEEARHLQDIHQILQRSPEDGVRVPLSGRDHWRHTNAAPRVLARR